MKITVVLLDHSGKGDQDTYQAYAYEGTPSAEALLRTIADLLLAMAKVSTHLTLNGELLLDLELAKAMALVSQCWVHSYVIETRRAA